MKYGDVCRQQVTLSHAAYAGNTKRQAVNCALTLVSSTILYYTWMTPLAFMSICCQTCFQITQYCTVLYCTYLLGGCSCCSCFRSSHSEAGAGRWLALIAAPRRRTFWRALGRGAGCSIGWSAESRKDPSEDKTRQEEMKRGGGRCQIKRSYILTQFLCTWTCLCVAKLSDRRAVGHGGFKPFQNIHSLDFRCAQHAIKL